MSSDSVGKQLVSTYFTFTTQNLLDHYRVGNLETPYTCMNIREREKSYTNTHTCTHKHKHTHTHTHKGLPYV